MDTTGTGSLSTVGYERDQIAAPGLRMPSGQSVLDPAVELHRVGAELTGQPRPCQATDAVFTGDGAAQPDSQISCATTPADF